jgi:hypothetical protein
MVIVGPTAGGVNSVQTLVQTAPEANLFGSQSIIGRSMRILSHAIGEALQPSNFCGNIALV